MFLKELKIENRQGIIRVISFHKGLNLIVDETPEGNRKKTGNNIGKTTILRLVDYCLGSDGKNIYQDSEFEGQENTKIKDFLIDTEVLITVTLVDDLDYPIKEVIIEKNFLKRNKKVQRINGNNIKNDNFDSELKQVIFDTSVKKPTLKQIISKNIRDEKNKLANIVKVLNPYTIKEEYEALFLFWLGISTATHEEKEALSKEKTKEDNYRKRLRKEGDLSLIEQQLLFTESKIKELQRVKETYKFNKNLEEQINEINEVKGRIAKLSTELSRLDMRRELIVESKEDLEKEKTNVDVSQIELLYKKATRLIPDLQVSFEQVVRFHNDLISEKIVYITKELPLIREKIKEVQKSISSFRKREKELSEIMNGAKDSKAYEAIIIELNKLFEQKGRFEEKKRYWISSDKKIKKINEDLETVNSEISSQNTLIQDRITIFNKFFTKTSNTLYGEEYLLSAPKEDRGYTLVVTNIEGNPSTGKKKGQIAAFDFAYVLFAEEIGISLLHFIMHDQLENMHDNQLNTILIELANSINCQFILPIVRDKIPEDIDISEYVAIELSEDDKLFKIT